MSERERIHEQRMDHGTIRFLQIGAGRDYSHFQCVERLKASVRQTMRWFSRSIGTRPDWDDPDMNAADLRDLRLVLDDLQAYVEVVQRELDRLEGADRRAERIKKLREIAGRTPEEAAEFLRKAEQLKRAES